MTDRIAELGRLLSVLLLLSGCVVELEDLKAVERTETGSPSASGTGGQAGSGSEGSAGSDAAQPSEAGSAGAAGAAGAPAEPQDGSGSDAPPADGLCPTTTEYALKYFDALKDSGPLATCTESSCAAGECCWKHKGCVAL